jgi:hypothetical protein
MVDVEQLLIPWLSSTLSARALTDVPADLLAALPVIRVARIGGADDDNNPRFDAATVTVDWFGADRTAASDLAQAGHHALRVLLPRMTFNGVTVTFVQTISAPSWRPWDDTDVRRYGATYRLFIKS